MGFNLVFKGLMKLVGEGIWQWTCLGELWCQKENTEKRRKLCHSVI